MVIIGFIINLTLIFLARNKKIELREYLIAWCKWFENLNWIFVIIVLHEKQKA